MSCFAVPAMGAAAWEYRPVFSRDAPQPAEAGVSHDQFVRKLPALSVLFGRRSLSVYEDAEIFSQMEEAIGRIHQYTACGKNRFLKEPLAQDAVAYNLAQLGIWGKQLPESVRQTHPELNALRRLRNQLVHDAKSVSPEVLWQNASKVLVLDLPTIQTHPEVCGESSQFSLILPSRRGNLSAPAHLQKEMEQRISRISHYLSRIHSQNGFASNQKLQDAIAYNLMVIGEASCNLDSKDAQTVWAALNTLTEVRNQLAHPEDHPQVGTAAWLWQQLVEGVNDAISGVCEYFASQGSASLKSPLPAWATR